MRCSLIEEMHQTLVADVPIFHNIISLFADDVCIFSTREALLL